MAAMGEGPSFVAIDFETADFGRDSACAVGMVRVEKNRIVRSASRLIRPPRRDFVFSYIHGITWEHVADAAPFAQVWSELRELAQGVDFLAAHNAPFDRSVLNACCRSAGMEPPPLPFECSVRLARKQWGIRPTTLPDVCRVLGLQLRHHDALSDAEACARIMIAALEGRLAQ